MDLSTFSQGISQTSLQASSRSQIFPSVNINFPSTGGNGLNNSPVFHRPEFQRGRSDSQHSQGWLNQTPKVQSPVLNRVIKANQFRSTSSLDSPSSGAYEVALVMPIFRTEPIDAYGPIYVEAENERIYVGNIHQDLQYDLNIKSINEPNPMQNFKTTAQLTQSQNCLYELDKGKMKVSSGKLFGLVELLTNSAGEQDSFYTTSFLRTYRYFASALDVSRLLIFRYITNSSLALNLSISEDALQKESIVQMRVLNTFRKWTAMHPEDFDDDDMLHMVVCWIETFVKIHDGKRQSAASSMLLNLEQSLVELEKRKKTQKEAAEKLDPNRVSGNFCQAFVGNMPTASNVDTLEFFERVGSYGQIMDYTPEDLSLQLALIEHDLYAKVPVSELFHQRWNASNKRNVAQNLCNLTDNFNRMSRLFASEIVRHTALEDRVATLKNIIFVGQQCFKIYNLNSVFQIVAGLNSAAITRLKKTWKCLPKKYIEVWEFLNAIVSDEENYRRYRMALTAIREKHGSSACVPYLGVFLKDLTFSEDGNATFLNVRDGIINYQKFAMIGEILERITVYQQNSYRKYARNEPFVQEWVKLYPILSDGELYSMSKCIEEKST